MTKRKGTDEHLRFKKSGAQLSAIRESLRADRERLRATSHPYLPDITDEQFFELTKKQRLAPGEPPPWPGYTSEERETILAALPGATKEYIIDLIERAEMVVRIPELDINEIYHVIRNLVGARDNELNDIDKAIRTLRGRVTDMNDIISNGDYPDPIHNSAASALHALEIYREHLCEERDDLINEVTYLRSHQRPSAENLFKKMLFGLVEKTWRHAGGTVDFGDDYEKFFRAIVDPPFHDPWVRRVNGVAPSEGMFKNHVDAVRKRGKR